MNGHLTGIDAQDCYGIYMSNLKSISRHHESLFNGLRSNEKAEEVEQHRNEGQKSNLKEIRVRLDVLMDEMIRECEIVEEQFRSHHSGFRAWLDG